MNPLAALLHNARCVRGAIAGMAAEREYACVSPAPVYLVGLIVFIPMALYATWLDYRGWPKT